ncbi:RusA family crossover junction endodeoxyribonuclease [Prescottella agglutinans]|uniref:Crossover junction endodeoxyribonuclease RusA n=1 Tax=Prescottella agglutinans TaxID=1644129 RepID=A0ABT6MEY1_9NOCA|nr:RusA family crossover junction endodeoxyribonuclease [Prescottella agglutinans]MDH6282873.1 crossover junction endodeoxyribonuclease RusA [Prescottella agglutinans]
MGEIAFFTPGRPSPQGSKRHVGGGRMVESSKHVGSWRNQIHWHAMKQRRNLFVGPVALRLEFIMPRPKSLPKSKPTPPATKRTGDSDKLARAALDALSGACYHDDAQVIELHVYKRIAEPDEQSGVHITIQEAS